MRSLEEIKKYYCIGLYKDNPSQEEIEFYSITNDLLKKWRTENVMIKRDDLFNTIDKLINTTDSKNKFDLMEWIPIYFRQCTYVCDYEEYYYQEIPKILKKMYENDMFDFLSYKEYAPRTRELVRLMFANQDFSLLQPGALIYKNQRYAGRIPLLYYSGHLGVFEDILKYYANYIYQKYGLYIQESMDVLIKMCKDYNLPYVEMLEDAKKRAKELDYPTHHEYKYQFISRVNVEWE